MSSKILYQEIQYSKWSITIFILVLLFISFNFFYPEIANEHLSFTAFITISLVLLAAFLIFFRLEIKITPEAVTASFAFGALKRKIQISEIDFSSIRVERVPLIYGIGLRYTPKGLLYNTRPGDAIWMKSKSGKKIFFATSDNPSEIMRILQQLS